MKAALALSAVGLAALTAVCASAATRDVPKPGEYRIRVKVEDVWAAGCNVQRARWESGETEYVVFCPERAQPTPTADGRI